MLPVIVDMKNNDAPFHICCCKWSTLPDCSECGSVTEKFCAAHPVALQYELEKKQEAANRLMRNDTTNIEHFLSRRKKTRWIITLLTIVLILDVFTAIRLWPTMQYGQRCIQWEIGNNDECFDTPAYTGLTIVSGLLNMIHSMHGIYISMQFLSTLVLAIRTWPVTSFHSINERGHDLGVLCGMVMLFPAIIEFWLLINLSLYHPQWFNNGWMWFTMSRLLIGSGITVYWCYRCTIWSLSCLCCTPFIPWACIATCNCGPVQYKNAKVWCEEWCCSDGRLPANSGLELQTNV